MEASDSPRCAEWKADLRLSRRYNTWHQNCQELDLKERLSGLIVTRNFDFYATIHEISDKCQPRELLLTKPRMLLLSQLSLEFSIELCSDVFVGVKR